MRSERNSLSRRSRVLLVLTAGLALFQAGAVIQALQIPADLAAQISLLLPVQLIANLIWTMLAGVVTVIQWQRRPNAKRLAVGLLLAFSIYSLIRLLLFAQADYDRQRLGFLTLLIGLIAVITVIGSFVLSRRHSTEIIQK